MAASSAVALAESEEYATRFAKEVTVPMLAMADEYDSHMAKAAALNVKMQALFWAKVYRPNGWQRTHRYETAPVGVYETCGAFIKVMRGQQLPKPSTTGHPLPVWDAIVDATQAANERGASEAQRPVAPPRLTGRPTEEQLDELFHAVTYFKAGLCHLAGLRTNIGRAQLYEICGAKGPHVPNPERAFVSAADEALLFRFAHEFATNPPLRPEHEGGGFLEPLDPIQGRRKRLGETEANKLARQIAKAATTTTTTTTEEKS